VAEDEVLTLDVFKGTVEVMLTDEFLSLDEKRLIIKLANQLGLGPDEPAMVYEAIREGREINGGRAMNKGECIRIFTRMYEVAIINESVSIDEENVLAHLRHHLNIEDEDYEQVVDGLKKIITEKYDDNMVGLMLNTLSDSVTLVGRLFDSVRTKSA
jgi:predicted KAP-like P-loop ATPase